MMTRGAKPARRIARSTCPSEAGDPAAPPPLSYYVDTLRLSPRTNWTRRASSGGAGMLKATGGKSQPARACPRATQHPASAQQPRIRQARRGAHPEVAVVDVDREEVEARRHPARPAQAPRHALSIGARSNSRDVQVHGVRDAACPLSTRGGTRLVHLVRGEGRDLSGEYEERGGGATGAAARWTLPWRGACAASRSGAATGSRACCRGAPRGGTRRGTCPLSTG